MLEQRNVSVKKLALATLLLAALVIGVGSSAAQTTNTTPTPVATTAGPSNDSQGTLFVCSDQAVLTFSGTSLVGWDIFYQIFSGSSGSGTAITGVRQVPVAGIYTGTTDKVSYNSGVTVAAGGTASAKVDIARESDPTKIDFSYVLTDAQDGCNISNVSEPTRRRYRQRRQPRPRPASISASATASSRPMVPRSTPIFNRKRRSSSAHASATVSARRRPA